MNIIIICIYIVIHIGCGIIAAGISFATFQGRNDRIAEEDYYVDLCFSYSWGLFFGPLGLLEAIFLSGFMKRGIKFK